MNILLQRATPHHLAEILPLVAAYHACEHIDSSAQGRASAVRRLLQDTELGGIWRIEVDSQLAGYIALCRGFSIEFNGYDAFVDEFFLLPEFRGRGIGKSVLARIGSEARKLDINALHLEVARENEAARKLYAAAGFVARDRYLLMSLALNDASAVTTGEENDR
jgi:GNAT superfamily N-acetyltransferase